MHKQRANELKLSLVIEPLGPLLIKSGVESGADPTLPSMNFVRARHPRYGTNTVYLPGSSLKGVIRSHCERILRTVKGDSNQICCDPLNRSCASWIQKKKVDRTAAKYELSCLACRIFGSTEIASHFQLSDAYPLEPIDVLPVRQNVAIDRLSGAAQNPFDMEVAHEGQFVTTLHLFNFELWQVGLLALALRDIAEGRVRLGFAKSRGLGLVRLYLAHMEISYPGHFGDNGYDFQNQLYGVGALLKDKKLLNAYGFVTSDDLALSYESAEHFVENSSLWGRPTLSFGLKSVDGVDSLTTDSLVSANNEIAGILGQTVTSWANYQKPKKGRS